MKRSAYVVVAAFFVLGGYMVWRALDLLTSGRTAGVLFGVGVLILTGLGALLVVGEVRLAAASERLGQRLFAEGFVEDDLPLLPSGRVDRDAALQLFAKRKAEAEAAPGDWRRWFLLATAYDAARDPSAGRKAMRKAIALEASDQGQVS